ncbi:MAG: hypothetical protein IJ080_05190 [Oscillospiraceae bacterium]|nr:hypothetical protein [Oscillospiraceae bacterium]MBQ8979143.1 hypothetical protein [Oscillospiraceae bacterium]
MKASTRVALVILSVICALWALLPDPVTIAVDDVIAGLGSVASALTVISTLFKKTPQIKDKSGDNVLQADNKE